MYHALRSRTQTGLLASFLQGRTEKYDDDNFIGGGGTLTLHTLDQVGLKFRDFPASFSWMQFSQGYPPYEEKLSRNRKKWRVEI